MGVRPVLLPHPSLPPHRGEAGLPSACQRLLLVGEGEEAGMAWQWAERDSDGAFPTYRSCLALEVRRRMHG
jgi:hypothetical protein